MMKHKTNKTTTSHPDSNNSKVKDGSGYIEVEAKEHTGLIESPTQTELRQGIDKVMSDIDSWLLEPFGDKENVEKFTNHSKEPVLGISDMIFNTPKRTPKMNVSELFKEVLERHKSASPEILREAAEIPEEILDRPKSADPKDSQNMIHISKETLNRPQSDPKLTIKNQQEKSRNDSDRPRSASKLSKRHSYHGTIDRPKHRRKKPPRTRDDIDCGCSSMLGNESDKSEDSLAKDVLLNTDYKEIVSELDTFMKTYFEDIYGKMKTLPFPLKEADVEVTFEVCVDLDEKKKQDSKDLSGSRLSLYEFDTSSCFSDDMVEITPDMVEVNHDMVEINSCLSENIIVDSPNTERRQRKRLIDFDKENLTSNWISNQNETSSGNSSDYIKEEDEIKGEHHPKGDHNPKGEPPLIRDHHPKREQHPKEERNSKDKRDSGICDSNDKEYPEVANDSHAVLTHEKIQKNIDPKITTTKDDGTHGSPLRDEMNMLLNLSTEHEAETPHRQPYLTTEDFEELKECLHVQPRTTHTASGLDGSPGDKPPSPELNEQVNFCPPDLVPAVAKPHVMTAEERALELDRCLTNDSLLSVIYEQSSVSESDLEDTVSMTDDTANNTPREPSKNTSNSKPNIKFSNIPTDCKKKQDNPSISNQKSQFQPTNEEIPININQKFEHKITLNDTQKDSTKINQSFNSRISVNEPDDRGLGMSLGFDTDEQTYDSSACESFQVTDREDSSVCSTVRSTVDVEGDEENVLTVNVSMKLHNPQDDDVNTIKVHITPNEQSSFPTSSQAPLGVSPRPPRIGRVNVNVECSEDENGTTPRQKYESTTSFEVIDDDWSVTRSEVSESEDCRSGAENRLFSKTRLRDHITRSKKSRRHNLHDSTVFSSFEVLGSRNSLAADSERSEKVSFKFSPKRFRKKKNRASVSTDDVTMTSSPSLDRKPLNDSYLFSSFEHLDDSFYFKRSHKMSQSACSSFIHLDEPDVYMKTKSAEDSGFSSLSAEKGIPECGNLPVGRSGDLEKCNRRQECLSSGDEYGGLTQSRRRHRVEMKDRPKRKMKKKPSSWLMCAPFLCSK